MKQLNVLIACEESQAETMAFRQIGHRAFSCDIKPCRRGTPPEWHIQDDVLPILDGVTTFATQDGTIHTIIGREHFTRSQKQWQHSGRNLSSMNSQGRHYQPIQRNYSRQSRPIDQQLPTNSTHIGEPFNSHWTTIQLIFAATLRRS